MMRPTPGGRDSEQREEGNGGSAGGDAMSTIGLAAWGAASAVTMFFVAYSAVYLPFQDDWRFTAVFLGEEPLSLEWVWARHAGHAFPLTRLVVTAIWRLAAGDSRWVYVLNAALASAGSLWLLLSVYEQRKRGSIFDLILVIHGVSLVHYWSLLQNINLSFMIYLFLFSFILGAMLRGFWNSTPLSAAVGAAVVLLSVNAGYGLAVSLVFVPYLAVVAAMQLRRGDGRARARGAMLAGLVVPAAVGCVWGILPSLRAAGRGRGGGGEAGAMVEVAAKALGMAWPRIGRLLPSEFENLGQMMVVVVTGVTVLAGVVMLARRREDRPLVGSLAAAFLAIGVLGGAIGFGRVDYGGEPGGAIWYATLAAPFPMTAYLVLDRLRIRPLRYGCAAVLLMLAAMAAARSWGEAWKVGSFRRGSGIALTGDARAGISGEELHARFHAAFAPWDRTLSMAPTLELFRARGLGPYDEGKGIWMPQIEEGLRRRQKWGSEAEPDSRLPEPLGRGRVVSTGEVIVFEVADGEGWFELPLLSPRGTRAWLLELQVRSPAATEARFRVGEEELQVCEVREGFNALQFIVRPEGAGRLSARFSPGRVAGNYRLEATNRYELP